MAQRELAQEQGLVEPEAKEPSIKLSPNAQGYLHDHLATVQNKIVKRAKELADAESVPLEIRHVTEAAKEFAPGTRIFPCPEPDPSLISRISSGITGVTVIAAILAVVFAALGIFNAVGGQQSTLLDLAKLMAGAIVGSTGAAVAVGRRT